jgi:SAM-dependent methyltransferase
MYLRSPLPHILISLSSGYAYENAMRYWATAEKTHRDVSKASFNTFYRRIAEVVKPRKGETILDAGCGGGEITHAFREDGYKTVGFDASEKLIDRAKERYGDAFYIDDFVSMNVKDRLYSKIFMNNAFFYVHPRQYFRVLHNFYDILVEGGKLYLLDNPDYAKRKALYKNQLKKVFTAVFPVYDANNSGFWVKETDVSRSARKIGFSKVERLDNAAFYRSHVVLEK